ncbi:hypothetical protein SAMN05443572_109145 [Myxococcus fulvus]|uniref:Uncharacterized protein n=1 Tax=Myxococcus fulvus TaxID=33 RepID=A0ABY1CR89_MYXFU|nr:hypothetical protein SAMN05443572_109145 [Myxococcus fulvus]
MRRSIVERTERLLRDLEYSNLTNRTVRGLRLAAFGSAEGLTGDFERASIEDRVSH